MKKEIVMIVLRLIQGFTCIGMANTQLIMTIIDFSNLDKPGWGHPRKWISDEVLGFRL